MRRSTLLLLYDVEMLELLLGALTAFGALSIDMYLPAFPRMAESLGTGPRQVELTLAVFFAGLGVGQLGVGPLLERFGRTGPLKTGLGLYGLASAGCALAPTVELLIAARFLQALGASAALVAPRAVVRDLFSGVEVARTLSRLMLVMGVAPILAPFLGGVLLQSFGWRSIFWVLTGLSIASLAGVYAILPETAPPAELRRSAGLRAQLRALLIDSSFLLNSGVVAFGMAGMFAYIAASPFVYISLFGVPAGRFGLFFGANALGLIAASQLNRRLLGHFSPRKLLGVGLGLAATAALGLIAAAWTGVGGLWSVGGSLFLFLVSLGGITPNATALAVEHQGQRAGLASAVMGAAQFGLAAAASSIAGKLHTGTAVPMAATVLGCALCASVLYRLSLLRSTG